MTDTITTDTVDRTIEALKATRDGLSKTLMDEEHERAKRTQTLVETAHTWADRHGISGFEPMMEELSLPGRAPRRHFEVGNSGYLTLHYTFPYSSTLLTSSRAARLVDVYDPNVTLTERLYVGSQIEVGRVDGNHCVCDWKMILDNYGFDGKVTRVLNEDVGIVITVEGELSCDSPSCTHGETEVETTEGVDDQPCALTDHPTVQHFHYRTTRDFRVVRSARNREYIDSGSVISSGTFVRETANGEVITASNTVEGHKVYTQDRYPTLFRRALESRCGSTVLMVENPSGGSWTAVGDTAAWTVSNTHVRTNPALASFIGKMGFWVGEWEVARDVAIDEANHEASPEEPVHRCEDFPFHPDGVHLHVSDEGGHMMFSSDLTFTEPRWTFHGRFDKTATTPEPEPAPERDTFSVYLCTESSHPDEGMHQHFTYDSGLVTYADEDWTPDADSDGRRVHGLFTKEERTLQSCNLEHHPVGAEHRHFVNSNAPTGPGAVGHATNLDFGEDYSGTGRTRSPGTFRRDVEVTETAHQPCAFDNHTLTGAHRHFRSENGHITEGRIGGPAEVSGDYNMLPGTFSKEDDDDF